MFLKNFWKISELFGTQICCFRQTVHFLIASTRIMLGLVILFGFAANTITANGLTFDEVESLLELTDILKRDWQMERVDFIVDQNKITDSVFHSFIAKIIEASSSTPQIDKRIIQEVEANSQTLTRDHLTVVIGDNFRFGNGTVKGAWLLPSSIEINPLSLRFDSLIYQYELGGNITVTESYVFKHGSNITRTFELGRYDADEGIFVYTADEYIWERRSNLQKEPLIATYNVYRPISYYLDDGSFGGAFVDIARFFAESMNFTLDLWKQPDGKWGSKREDGSWSGMVGSLVEGRADLAVSGLRITQLRRDAIDLLDGVYQILITLMAHDSSKGSAIVLTRYFEAYSWQAWTSIAVILVAITGSVYRTFKQEPLKNPREIEVTQFSFVECLSLVFYMVIFQRDFNFGENPNASARMTFFITCLFGFVFFSGYSALLTATMMGFEAELNIETLDELAGSDLQLHLWEDSSTYDSFQLADPDTSRGLVYRTMIKGQLDKVFIGSNQEIHDKLESNPNSVFMDWDTILALYPDMYAVRSFRDFTPAQVSIGLQKDSEYQLALNHHLRKMDQSGIRSKLLRDHGIRLDYSPVENRLDAAALGFDNLLFPALVVFVGGVAAVAVGIIERIYTASKRIQIVLK